LPDDAQHLLNNRLHALLRRLQLLRGAAHRGRFRCTQRIIQRMQLLLLTMNSRDY